MLLRTTALLGEAASSAVKLAVSVKKDQEACVFMPENTGRDKLQPLPSDTQALMLQEPAPSVRLFTGRVLKC